MGSLVSAPKLSVSSASTGPSVNTYSNTASNNGAASSAPASQKNTASASGASTASASSDAAVTVDSSETQTQMREDNLLSRSRGLASTILTGFRGLLGQSNIANHRKTLLGE